MQDISISSGTAVNTANAWWQNTASWSAVGYSRPYYVSESAAVESPERESAPLFSLMSQRFTIPALRAVAIKGARATPMTFIPQTTTKNRFSILYHILTKPIDVPSFRNIGIAFRSRKSLSLAAERFIGYCMRTKQELK